MWELTQPLATLLAGGGVMASAGLAFGSGERSRRQARRHHESTQRADQDRLRHDRYSTCADQLGHSSPAVRLAGIYGLVSLADDWLAVGDLVAAQAAASAICGYLRVEPAQNVSPGEMNVRVAVLKELKSRSRWWNQARGIRTVNSQSSWMQLDTDLHHSHLDGVDLHHAQLAGISLSDSSLRSAELGAADLEVADLTRADLTGAQCVGLYARDAICNSAILHNANLEGATLGGCDFTNAVLAGANLRGASISCATLDGAVLDDAVVEGASFTRAQLAGQDDMQNLMARGARVQE